MLKQCFADCETTGLDSKTCAVIEISGVLLVGAIEEPFNFRSRPRSDDVIESEALEINKIDIADLRAYPDPYNAYKAFVTLLGKYVNKYDKSDKFIFYGWKASFDWDFLWNFFLKAGDKYFGSYFFWPPIDVAALVTEHLGEERGEIPDFHLDTVAKFLGIEVKEELRHGAAYDIGLTKQVYDFIKHDFRERR